MTRRNRKSGGDRNGGRLLSLGIVFPLLMGCVLARSFWFQVVRRGPWVALAEGQYEAREIMPAQRGTLYDRRLNIWAMDLPGASLAVDPTLVSDRDRMVTTLSQVLKGRPDDYRQMLFTDSRTAYVPLAKGVQPAQRRALEEARLEGLIFSKTLDRVRPGEGLALQAIGVTDANRRGAWGLELSLDRWIGGRDGWAIQQRDGYNRSHVSLDYPVEKPVTGHDVVLTLDHVLQTIVEEELQQGVLRHKAKAGTAVLMDPFSGEVLAMASTLGHVSRTGPVDFADRMHNRAVQWDYEPGSTFKIVALAAALEKGGFHADSLVFCENGGYRLGSNVINDHEKAFGWLSLSRVIEESSNIGIAKVAQAMGPKLLYEYARNFGFGNKTGIQLPGESSGILRPVYDWSDHSAAYISFGQELSATALQLAGMVSVIANGGELMKPRIVRQVIDADGRVVKSFDRQVIRRVITRRTAAQVGTILEKVVMKGSGSEATVPSIRIAGKTGTAQKSVPGHRGYLPNTRVSSFVGYWPAEAPRYAMIVVLDEPTYKYWGSRSAAPLFGQIVNRIEGLPSAGDDVRLSQEASPYTFASLGENRGDASVAPPVATPSVSPEASPYHVPNLVGLSVRQALTRLSTLGLEARPSGHGRVVRQSPEAGTLVTPDMVCQIVGADSLEELP